MRGSYFLSKGHALPAPMIGRYLDFTSFNGELTLETHGPLGTLWVGLGLGAFYTALIWVNLLLGHMLTPLFILPVTWLQDLMARRKAK
jgi:hypothetical protein